MARKRKWLHGVNVVASIGVTGFLIYCGTNGFGPLPPLGPAFNPGTGVWQAGADAQLPSSGTLHIAGLAHPVKVTFDKDGVAYIDAASDHDLFLAQGYVHARYRLTQMDLMRRQGEGRLSEVVGKKALSSDEFELQLGLTRTAAKEWAQMSANDPGRAALLAYTEGVNDVIDQDIHTGQLPVMFKLLGYKPQQWTPTDSLVIQGIMTQTLDFTDTPLDYALLEHSLGSDRTMQWFPVLPPNEQHPYDPGPYKNGGTSPLQSTAEQTSADVTAILDVKDKLRALPSTAVHHGSNSNNWAVDGTKTATGKPLMAGDPHLTQTLPSIWYQVSANAPDLHFSGVSIPGLPLILIGHNQHISWSLTDVQNQATFYYQEQTDAAHPKQYFWNGSWHPMQTYHYTIPIKGEAAESLDVETTVHGPIMTSKGQTMSVDWMGSIPTPGIDILLQMTQSTDWTGFRTALKNWHAPSQNFVYADDNGNIGLISAGDYPIFKHGDPWAPMSGTGESDIVGIIPFDDIPQVYNPPSHIVFTANQRPVGPTYPYYIGTTLNFFDAGYRADEIFNVLSKGSQLTTRDMEKLQNDMTDHLAAQVVPKLVQSLNQATLSPEESQAVTQLKSWNDSMDADSTAATIWWTFWNQYLQDTFGPWWQAKNVPVAEDPDLKISPNLASLDETLQSLTLSDPNNGTFSLPDGTKRTASDVMRKAFKDTVSQLTKELDNQPADWQWGRIHSREFDSLEQIPALGYGPYSSGGDNWTVDAADSADGLLSKAGPSWRFIMDWGSGRGEGIYPGGQSENPLSAWYENLVSAWWNGSYHPMYDDAHSDGMDLQAQWDLTPASAGQGEGNK